MENLTENKNNPSNSELDQWQKMADEVLQQSQKESIPTHNESFETIKDNQQKNYDTKVAMLEKLKQQLAATDETDSRKVNFLNNRIEKQTATVDYIGGILKRMRPNNERDLEMREEVLTHFAKIVNEVIPDEEPVVFHGVDNINTVEEIIDSGGLKTPEERGADFTSFATQIDVAAKKNIQTSCNFADAGAHSFLPYGGMFVFYPKDHEKEKVLSTGNNTEVYGGISGVNLDEDRFMGLITTDENTDELKELFRKNNLDDKKVFTHEQFLDFCKDTYPDKNE